jgi:lipoate-protein ligase A
MIYEATPAAGTSLESAYQNLCAPLLDTLLECGIRADVGRVDGSFCDGRYNLTVHGRKIAGTAQKWKSGPDGRRTVLSQAMLIVEFSGLAPGIAAINEFYANLGLPQRFDADRCIGLDRLLCATPADAERALMREIRERLLRRCQGLMLF